MTPKQSFILCEGYHDRSFLSGWLRRTNCVGDRDTKDLSKARLGGGQFGFYSGINFIKVIPCEGDKSVLREAKLLLEKNSNKLPDYLIFNIDPDTDSNETSNNTPKTGKRLSDVKYELERLFKDEKPSLILTYDTNEKWLVMTDSADADVNVQISLIRWEVLNQEDCPGLPTKQCLERVVCCALLRAYPERAELVQRWLDSLGEDAKIVPKSHSWSHMAGWFAEKGCDEFLQAIWRDENIALELEAILKANGSQELIDMIV